MVRVRDFFDPFPASPILKSKKLFQQLLGEKYGVDGDLFWNLVRQFEIKYYKKYKASKK